MEDDRSFVAPGHLPSRWHGPQNYPHCQQGHYPPHPGQKRTQNYQHTAHVPHNTWGYQHSGYNNPNNTQPYYYYTQHSKAQAYHHQPETFFCGPCNRTFHSQYQMDKHLQEHVKCPFPECKLSAHQKVIEKHIDNQHLLINFAQLQIDDEAWIAERKRKFPTKERAEMRRTQQLEKFKRGEKLGKNAKLFAPKGDREKGRVRGHGRGRGKVVGSVSGDNRAGSSGRGGGGSSNLNNKRERLSDSELSNQKGRKRRKMIQDNRTDNTQEQKKDKDKNHTPTLSQQRHRGTSVIVPTVPESDSEDENTRDGILGFRGTRHFYETNGEISYFGMRSGTALECNKKEKEEEGSNQMEDHISDEEEWEVSKCDSASKSTTLVLGGALGSLMGAYSDSGSEEDDDNKDIEQTKKVNHPTSRGNKESKNTENEELPKSFTVDVNHHTFQESKGRNENTKNEPETTQTSVTRKGPRQHRRKRQQRNTTQRGKNHRKGAHNSFPRRRKRLLERLLLPDITRERNIILQCVRFIIQNNFLQLTEERKTEDKGNGAVEMKEGNLSEKTNKKAEDKQYQEERRQGKEYERSQRDQENQNDVMEEEGNQKENEESMGDKRLEDNCEKNVYMEEQGEKESGKGENEMKAKLSEQNKENEQGRE